MTDTTKLPSAVPVTDFVWCLACGEPHACDVAADGSVTIRIETSDTCPSVTESTGLFDVELPKGWENDYVAEFGSGGGEGGKQLYNLVPKNAPVNDDHRPMYYLEETT